MKQTFDPAFLDAFARLLARPDPAALPRRAHHCCLRVRESRTLGPVGANPNGLAATRPHPTRKSLGMDLHLHPFDHKLREGVCRKAA